MNNTSNSVDIQETSTVFCQPTDDQIHNEIDEQINIGLDGQDKILEKVFCYLSESAHDPALESRIKDLLKIRFNARVQEQLSWGITDCERLDAALASLELDGLVTRQNYTCCSGGGGSSVVLELLRIARYEGWGNLGAVYYTQQDLIFAISMGCLVLRCRSHTSEQDQSGMVCRMVLQALNRQGLTAMWQGAPNLEIYVRVNWKRRLRKLGYPQYEEEPFTLGRLKAERNAT